MIKNKLFITSCLCVLNYAFSADKACTELDLLNFAYKPLRVVDQVEKSGIFSQESSDATSSTDIYRISLAGIDFNLDKTQEVVEYLCNEPLPRLRSLDLSGCKNVGALLNHVFESTDKKFFSLTSINLKNSDASIADVRGIVAHLVKYDKLVRDMPAYSERLSAHVIQSRIIVDDNIPECIESPKNPVFIYYRAGGFKHGQAIHQITVEH